MNEKKQAALALNDYVGAAHAFAEAIDLATIRTEHFKDLIDPSDAGITEYENAMIMMKIKKLDQILESIR